MKHKQDIEKIFQDNRHGLDERPSERAWNRLESRLDGNPSIEGRQGPAFRLMGMAAGILFLVSMIGLMSILFRQSEHHHTASKDVLSIPAMEELEKFENEKGVYAIAVSFQKYLNQSPKTIAEGSGNKRLLAPTDVNQNSPGTDHIVQANTQKAKNKKLEIPARGNTAKDAAAKKEVQDKNEELAEYSIPATSNKVEVPASPKPATPVAEAAEADIILATEAMDVGVESEEAVTYAEADYNSKAKAQRSNPEASPPPPSYKPARDLDAVTNVITYSSNTATADLAQFQWLIGQWNNSMGYNQQSIERWEQKDDFTIAGSGKLVVNGDTTFTEGMKIQKIGDQLYYILAIDEQQQEVRFRLRSIEAQMAIFETEEKGVPNQQLILQQHSSNNYSTTLQNVAPKPLEQKQLQYLQNRNNMELNNNRSVRNMSRSY